MLQIDITEFLRRECMRDYSASVAEIGADAGRYTWQACTENAPDWQFLKTAEDIAEFRRFVQSSGFGDSGEVEGMQESDLQALCLQWIAADARNCGADVDSPDWPAIRHLQESGQVSSSIWPGDDGRIYWTECA